MSNQPIFKIKADLVRGNVEATNDHIAKLYDKDFIKGLYEKYAHEKDGDYAGAVDSFVLIYRHLHYLQPELSINDVMTQFAEAFDSLPSSVALSAKHEDLFHWVENTPYKVALLDCFELIKEVGQIDLLKARLLSYVRDVFGYKFERKKVLKALEEARAQYA